MSGAAPLRRRADITIPSECRKLIEHGALVSISHSGGKDSQATTILLSKIVPHDQLIAVHAPLGEVEWPGTLEHIEATLPEGVPLIFAPVTSGKSLLDRVEERGMWPSNKARWCTSDFKSGPIERELRRYLKAHSRFARRMVNAMGMRADESAAQARKQPWRRNDRKAALRQFYMALWRGAIEGWSLADFEEATGLKLVYEGALKEDLPPMSRFLNRLLALPIAEQNQLFAALETRIEANIEQAMEAGSYEVGVETVRADSLATAGRETLYEHPRSGRSWRCVRGPSAP